VMAVAAILGIKKSVTFEPLEQFPPILIAKYVPNKIRYYQIVVTNMTSKLNAK